VACAGSPNPQSQEATPDRQASAANRTSADALDRLRRWPYKRGPEGYRSFGNLYVATGDVNADGRSDIILGAPLGETWGVAIFDGRTDALISQLRPFGSRYTGGVTVAAGDHDGDGHDDILCATASAGMGNVLYDGATRKVLRKGLRPFPLPYDRGLSVAIGDIDGDGLGELVMGQGPGAAGRITVYRGAGGVLGRGLSPFGDSAGQGGVVLATADLDRDGRRELIAGSGIGVSSSLRIYRYTDHFSAYRKGLLRPFGSSRCGLSVAGGDVDGDGRDDLLVGSACGGRAIAYSFANQGTSVLPRQWYPFGRDRLVGARVAVAAGSRPLVFAPVSSCDDDACADTLPIDNLRHVIPYRVNFHAARHYDEVAGYVTAAFFDLRALEELSPVQTLETPVVVHLHWELFDGPDYGDGLPQSPEQVASYSIAADIDKLLGRLEPHIENIEAIYVSDEPYRWGLKRSLLEGAISKIKQRFPKTPTWITFSHDCFDPESPLPACSRSVRDADRGIPANVDWVAFDSYAWDIKNGCGYPNQHLSPVKRCFQALIVPRVLRLTQLTSKPILLVTESASLNLSVAQQLEHFNLSIGLATRFKQIIGLAPWQWGDVTPLNSPFVAGIRSHARLRSHILTYARRVRWQAMLGM
jgi:hypothetical protein